MRLSVLPTNLRFLSLVPPSETGFYANGPETPNRLVFHRNHHKTVLYVEDDLADIYLFNRALEEAGDGERLVAFRDPYEAFLVCVHSDTAPDVVVLDINMPKIGGMELLDKLRALPLFKSVPFVLLTTASSERNRAESAARGADLFLVKPPTFEGYPEAAAKVLALMNPKRND